jgi:hypothetical protein
MGGIVGGSEPSVRTTDSSGHSPSSGPLRSSSFFEELRNRRRYKLPCMFIVTIIKITVLSRSIVFFYSLRSQPSLPFYFYTQNMLFHATASVSDREVESDARSLTYLESYLENKEMRLEGCVATGALETPKRKIRVHFRANNYLPCLIFEARA